MSSFILAILFAFSSGERTCPQLQGTAVQGQAAVPLSTSLYGQHRLRSLVSPGPALSTCGPACPTSVPAPGTDIDCLDFGE